MPCSGLGNGPNPGAHSVCPSRPSCRLRLRWRWPPVISHRLSISSLAKQQLPITETISPTWLAPRRALAIHANHSQLGICTVHLRVIPRFRPASRRSNTCTIKRTSNGVGLPLHQLQLRPSALAPLHSIPPHSIYAACRHVCRFRLHLCAVVQIRRSLHPHAPRQNAGGRGAGRGHCRRRAAQYRARLVADSKHGVQGHSGVRVSSAGE